MSRASDERERLVHELERMRATVKGVETALKCGGVIGAEAGQALTTTAVALAVTIARHDAYIFAAEDASAEQRIREMLSTPKRSNG